MNCEKRCDLLSIQPYFIKKISPQGETEKGEERNKKLRRKTEKMKPYGSGDVTIKMFFKRNNRNLLAI